MNLFKNFNRFIYLYLTKSNYHCLPGGAKLFWENIMGNTEIYITANLPIEVNIFNLLISSI